VVLSCAVTFNGVDEADAGEGDRKGCRADRGGGGLDRLEVGGGCNVDLGRKY